MKQLKPDTTCIHAGYEPKNGEPRVVPIAQSTTYTYDSAETMGKLFDLEADGFFYTRLANPTLDAVEKKIAALEGGVGAMITNCGFKYLSCRRPYGLLQCNLWWYLQFIL